MKSKNIIFTIVLVILILVVIMVKFIPNILNNKNNYDDLTVYKNNNIVTISDQEKNKITEYLKKEDFNKPNIPRQRFGGYCIQYACF